ncbi:hypothetical protein M9H77_17635 [Catharanthus roseus]|uniref:Uncharacterized protein n=1 Tax=Catharanthus roseus TaxID=4058 RepID=A0ACC0B579_CATRO|nr:hypothetical protein M9H77_17635 [Catharanthus roseus]
MLTFEVYYGGRFEFEPLLNYVDGKIFYGNSKRIPSLRRLRLPHEQEIYYKLPNFTFEDGLRELNSDAFVVSMVEHHLLLDIALDIAILYAEVGGSSENGEDDSFDETYMTEEESSD